MSALLGRAEDLRARFDRRFAEPLPVREPVVDLLAIRVGTDRYAVRLSQVDGLVTGRPVTPLPGVPPHLLGIAGLRGELVAVYDLGAILGGPVAGTPRWVLLAAGTPRAGYAFDELDGHLRVPARSLVATGHPQDAVSAVVTGGDQPRPVLDLTGIGATIQARCAVDTDMGGETT